MKKNVKKAIGISAAVLGAVAIAGIVYQLVSIRKLLTEADVDDMDLDDLFDDEIEAEEAFAELNEADA
jgi:hypothetical protein